MPFNPPGHSVLDLKMAVMLRRHFKERLLKPLGEIIQSFWIRHQQYADPYKTVEMLVGKAEVLKEMGAPTFDGSPDDSIKSWAVRLGTTLLLEKEADAVAASHPHSAKSSLEDGPMPWPCLSWLGHFLLRQHQAAWGLQRNLKGSQPL